MNKPQYVKVDDELYKINTDFRVALECNEIAEDDNIGDYERSLAIIYKLFGEKGLECKNPNKLLELSIKYLLLGNDEKCLKTQPRDKYELDFKKCEGLIKSSFKFDYNYDPYELEYLHFWDFENDLQNLSASDIGTCCILNRVASIINEDFSKIKDSKEQSKLKELQIELRRRYCKKNNEELTNSQKKNVVDLYKELGLLKGGK